MKSQHIQLTTNVKGPGRQEVLMGRTYRVVPATLVRSQVLHNNVGRCFLPAEAINAEWAEMANGTPVVIDHPTRGGQPLSARDPEVLNSMGAGTLFRTRAEDGELKADVFLDEALAEDIEELAAILEQLDAGKTVELSTGFPASGEPKTGVHNGEPYDLVIYPTNYDHTAVFADKKGACSVDDGCGLGVENEDGDGDGGEAPGGAGQKDAPSPEPSDEQAQNWARHLWVHLRKFIGNQDELSLDDIRGLIRDAAERRWGGPNVFTWVAELFEDDAVIGVDPQGDGERFFRVAYTVDEAERAVTLADDAMEVERVTEFVPAENGQLEARHEYLAANPTPEEGEMKREELINALCECKKVAFRRETLEAMTDEELAHVANQAEVGPDEGGTEAGEGAKPGAETAASTEDEKEKESEEPEGELAETVQAAVQAAVKPLAERLDALEEETEPARNQTAEERKRLVGDIAANSDYEEDELEDRPVAELRKLHNAIAKPRTYVGLGGPRPASPRKEGQLGFEVVSTLGCGSGKPIDQKKEN